MGKIIVVRGWGAVLNIHERVLPVSLDTVAPLLDSLGSGRDRLWPIDRWPPMLLDRGLAPGSRGWHTQIRYRLATYLPGRRVEFQFEPMAHLPHFAGRHVFEAFQRGELTVMRHTLDVEVDFRTWVRWKLGIERLHDAVIEDAFDRAEVQAHLPRPHRSRWSLYVRFLRWLRTRRH
jgi:hypothetical protein